MVNQKVWIEVIHTPLWYLSAQKTIKFYIVPHATLPNKVIILKFMDLNFTIGREIGKLL